MLVCGSRQIESDSMKQSRTTLSVETSGQGLIEITQGKRPKVAKPSAIAAAKIISLTLRRTGKALLDLVEARQSIECGIARCAALHAKPSHIKAMKKTIDDLNNRSMYFF